MVDVYKEKMTSEEALRMTAKIVSLFYFCLIQKFNILKLYPTTDFHIMNISSKSFSASILIALAV